MEQLRVVILMHRFVLSPVDAPRPVPVPRERAQRLQQTRHVPPAHLQALQGVFAAANVPPQHQVERHVPWMPGQHHPRTHMVWQLHTVAAMVVVKHKNTVRPHLPHACGEDKRTACIDRKAFLLINGGANGLSHIPINVPARAAHGIHSVANPVLLHHALPRSKGRKVLREGNRIPPELAQAGR